MRYFQAKVYFTALKSPWALILTVPVPEVLEFVPISGEVDPGDSAAFLHDMGFFFDWNVQPEDSRGEFQKNDATKPRKSQAVSQVLEKNTYRSIFAADK